MSMIHCQRIVRRSRLTITTGWTIVASLLGACSRESRKAETAAAKDTGKASGDMAEMPRSGTSAAADSSADVTLTAAQIQHGGVRWQAVTMGTAASAVSVPGQLGPNEDRTARLGAPAGGRVVSVHVQPGDRVTRGQIVVSLQSRDAGAAQADLAKAEAERAARQAEAAYAKSARDRAERLLALKAIPRQDYERAVTDDEHGRHALAQAEAELTRARSAADQLGATSSASGMSEVRSPLAGVVLARTAVPGTVVDAGAPLAIVTDPTTLWVAMSAPEAMSAAFRTGTTIRFTVPAYPGETFAARVDVVGAGLDPGTRTLPVRATVDNRPGRLKPEMIATVLANGGPPVPAALIPDSAVQTLKGRTVVFIARPQSGGGVRLVRREVEVGSRGDGRVAITRGLSAGDVIVTSGAFAVKAQIEKSAMPKMEM